MAHALWDADVPVWRIQPSASLLAEDGVPQTRVDERNEENL